MDIELKTEDLQFNDLVKCQEAVTHCIKQAYLSWKLMHDDEIITDEEYDKKLEIIKQALVANQHWIDLLDTVGSKLES